MSVTGDGPPDAEITKPTPTRRPQTNVRTMIALVACVAIILWAVKVVWDSRDPDLVEAHAIQNRALGSLRSPKAADRIAAIHELERLGVGDRGISIGKLTAALQDGDSQVRLAAAEGLGGLGANAIRAGTDGGEVRDAVTALIRSLKDPQPDVRVAAARTLGTIASTPPVPPRRGRGALAPVAAGASAIEPTSTIRGLVATLGDEDDKVRAAARAALADVGGFAAIDPPRELAAGLKAAGPETRAATAAALLNFRRGLDRWIPVLLELAEHDPDPGVRAACARGLGQLKPAAITHVGISAIAAGLKSGSPKIRMQTAALLGRLGPAAVPACPALVEVLNEPLDAEVARQHEPPRDTEAARRPGLWMLDDDPACVAADALSRIAPGSAATQDVVAALWEVARAGPRLRRGWAAFALGKFGPAAVDAVPSLIAIIHDTGPSVGDRYNQDAAAWALGQTAPDAPAADQAVAALVTVLQSESSDSRAAALRALGHFGPKATTALPKIRALQNDRDREVKDAATTAVRLIETASEPIDSNEDSLVPGTSARP